MLALLIPGLGMGASPSDAPEPEPPQILEKPAGRKRRRRLMSDDEEVIEIAMQYIAARTRH